MHLTTYNDQYRIVIETSRKGEKFYYVQERFFLYFWRYFTQIVSMDMASERVIYSSIEEAENAIQRAINHEHQRSQEKIVKQEVYVRNV